MDFATKNSVKAFLKVNRKRLGNGVCETLDAEIEMILRKACKRAEVNGRNTVMPSDV